MKYKVPLIEGDWAVIDRYNVADLSLQQFKELLASIGLKYTEDLEILWYNNYYLTDRISNYYSSCRYTYLSLREFQDILNDIQIGGGSVSCPSNCGSYCASYCSDCSDCRTDSCSDCSDCGCDDSSCSSDCGCQDNSCGSNSCDWSCDECGGDYCNSDSCFGDCSSDCDWSPPD